METLSPNIFVSNMPETIAFYKMLGFNVTMSVPENGDDLVWVMMVNGSVTIMFQTYESLGESLPEIQRKDGGSLLLYINLKNIREFLAHAIGLFVTTKITSSGAANARNAPLYF